MYCATSERGAPPPWPAFHWSFATTTITTIQGQFIPMNSPAWLSTWSTIASCNIYLFFRFRALPRFVWATCLASTSISTTSSCYSRTIKKISAVRLSSAASQGYFYLLSICQPMDTKQETISVLELINFLLFWIYFFMFSLPSHDSLDPSYSFNSSSRTRWLSSIGRVLGISSAHYREDNARHQPTWSLKRYTSSNSYQRPCCWRYYLLSWL